jgi:hypothetical protein
MSRVGRYCNIIILYYHLSLNIRKDPK